MVVITISGPHGAGKSTYAKAIAEALSLRYISSGKLFRKLAKESGLCLEDFSKKCEKDKSIDQKIDQLAIEEAKKGDVVLEGQLASWMAKAYADCNIYVTATFDTRIRRIVRRDGSDFNKAREETIARSQSEANRFKKIYDININDLTIYDLILSTERLSKEKCINILVAACQQFIEK